jgi:hypothetical protein
MSKWWAREHWGPRFDVVRIEHDPLEFNGPLLRKRDVELSAQEIERPGDDPREWRALRHNRRQVQREVEMALREGEDHVAAEPERREQLRAEFEDSFSWRLTRPFRAVRRLGRRDASE